MAPLFDLAAETSPEHVAPRGRGGLWEALVEADGAHRAQADAPTAAIDLDLAAAAHIGYLGRVDPLGSMDLMALATLDADAVIIDLDAERARRCRSN